MSYLGSLAWQPLSKVDLVNLARVHPLVANLYLLVYEHHALVEPPVNQFDSLAEERPLVANSARLGMGREHL